MKDLNWQIQEREHLKLKRGRGSHQKFKTEKFDRGCWFFYREKILGLEHKNVENLYE
jgi:hypothetical protein